MRFNSSIHGPLALAISLALWPACSSSSTGVEPSALIPDANPGLEAGIPGPSATGGASATGGRGAVDPSVAGTGGSTPPPGTGGRVSDGSVADHDTPSGSNPDGAVAPPADAGAAATEAATPPSADASPSPDRTPAVDPPPPAAGDGGAASSSFTCTMMIGIQATQEWYDVGFETMVPNGAWELVPVHSGFVELWADAKDPVWSTAILSPCTKNPTQPDRIVFVALNFDYTTLGEWSPALTAAVANLKIKYPSARRIELMSFIRAPGNKACSQAPAKRSTIQPAQDQAMDMVAAANPGLVVVAPKFEAKTCGEYSSNPPHPSPAGAAAWATMMANYYK